MAHKNLKKIIGSDYEEDDFSDFDEEEARRVLGNFYEQFDSQLALSARYGKTIAEENKEKLHLSESFSPTAIVIKNLPHGFYEKELRGYFGQFGKVLAVEVAKSLKTGASRGYAYIRFANYDVARIACDSMNNRLICDKIIKCELCRNPNMMMNDSTLLSPENCPGAYDRTINQMQKEITPTSKKVAKSMKLIVDRYIKYSCLPTHVKESLLYWRSYISKEKALRSYEDKLKAVKLYKRLQELKELKALRENKEGTEMKAVADWDVTHEMEEAQCQLNNYIKKQIKTVSKAKRVPKTSEPGEKKQSTEVHRVHTRDPGRLELQQPSPTTDQAPLLVYKAPVIAPRASSSVFDVRGRNSFIRNLSLRYMSKRESVRMMGQGTVRRVVKEELRFLEKQKEKLQGAAVDADEKQDLLRKIEKEKKLVHGISRRKTQRQKTKQQKKSHAMKSAQKKGLVKQQKGIKSGKVSTSAKKRKSSSQKA